jgi:hypothetical protein
MSLLALNGQPTGVYAIGTLVVEVSVSTNIEVADAVVTTFDVNAVDSRNRFARIDQAAIEVTTANVVFELSDNQRVLLENAQVFSEGIKFEAFLPIDSYLTVDDVSVTGLNFTAKLSDNKRILIDPANVVSNGYNIEFTLTPYLRADKGRIVTVFDGERIVIPINQPRKVVI